MKQKYYTIEVSTEGRYAFLPVGRGLYIRTHPGAVFVPCPEKGCKADAKHPCINLKQQETLDVRVPQSKIHPSRSAAYRAFCAEQKVTDEGGKVIKLRRKKA